MVPLPYLTNATKVVFNPQNSNQLFFIKNNNLYINSQTNVVVKNVVSYTIIGQHIIWLSTNGLLYNTDTATTTSTAITQTPLPISQTSVYTPYSALGNTFLQQDENVLLLNKDTATFENFYAPVNQIFLKSTLAAT